MKIVFAVLGVAAILGANALEGGHLEALLQVGAFIIVVGATVFLSLAHHSAGELMAACKAAMGGDEFEPGEAARHVAVLSTPRMIALGSGGLGFLLGMIHVFQNMDDPSKLGAGIAVALIATLYALIISEFVVGPLINRICARASAPKAQDVVNAIPSEPVTPAAPNMMIFLISTLGSLFALTFVLYALTLSSWWCWWG